MDPSDPSAVIAFLNDAQILELLALGLTVGLLGGLLGIGGGVIMIPALIFILGESAFGPNSFHVYKQAAIAATVLLSIPSAVRHLRQRSVVSPIVLASAAFASAASLVGVAAGSLFVAEYAHTLRRLFGAFLVTLVAFNEYQVRRGLERTENGFGADAVRRGLNLRPDAPVATRWGVYGLVVGVPAGVLAGLLGIGGGVWSTPGQHVFLGVRMRHAIGNSACLVLALSLVTAVAQTAAVKHATDVHWLVGLVLAGYVAPAAMLGAWLGAGLSHRMPRGPLRRGFHVLLALVGIRLLLW